MKRKRSVYDLVFFTRLVRNSRPLVADTGYWAESLPLMDAPLCAVIDPIRDYRWHALRCGGPETASFLCEMPGRWRFLDGIPALG